MSDNALVSPKSENKKLKSRTDLEFLEKLIEPDLRFEEYFLNKKYLANEFNRLKKMRVK